MRQETLEGCDSEETARDLAPWAAVVIEVEGGYMAFESTTDYETWASQV